MELTERKTCSFIIKIWLEETTEGGQVLWRGHITHVPSGNRRYLQDLDEIKDFITPWLERLGVKLG